MEQGSLGLPSGSVVKNLPANTGDSGEEDPLGEEMATRSNILAWEVPWTGAWWAAVYGVAEEWDMN